jgi:tetratricopeptide (TPR) repeat protein
MFLSSSHQVAQSWGAKPLQVLCVGFILLVSFVSVAAQSGVDFGGTGGKHIIQGRLYFPSGRRADLSVKVRLESPAAGELTVFADLNGSFSFRNLSAGSYTVVVDAGEEYEIHRESVYIDQIKSQIVVDTTPRIVTLPIHLQLKRYRAGGPKPGVINAALVNVPKPAVELYELGIKAAQAGDNKKAAEHLKAATLLYPDFALALSELGVQYLMIGEPDRAIEALQAALKLTPDEFTPRFSYGVALVTKKRFDVAAEQLRLALQKNDLSPIGHYYLGIALVGLNKLDDAEKEFRRTLDLPGSTDMAGAHRYLGGIYWGKRQYKKAADELEKYLKLQPKAPDGERTREAIKELRAKK